MRMKKNKQTMKSGRQKENSGMLLRRDQLDKYKTEGAISPQLRGQLKDHKEGEMPLREIANASNSPGHNLAKVLNKIFEPYTGKTKTAVKGGKHLVEIIKGGRFNKEFPASCDAAALYPSIMILEGLELLEAKSKSDKILKDKTDISKEEILIIELAKLCTESSYFE